MGTGSHMHRERAWELAVTCTGGVHGSWKSHAQGACMGAGSHMHMEHAWELAVTWGLVLTLPLHLYKKVHHLESHKGLGLLPSLAQICKHYGELTIGDEYKWYSGYGIQALISQ